MNLPTALETLTQTTLRNVIGEMEFPPQAQSFLPHSIPGIGMTVVAVNNRSEMILKRLTLEHVDRLLVLSG